jgi:hypothetical protein
MRVSYHPEFPQQIKKYEAQYLQISPSLGLRFRSEIHQSIQRNKSSPGSAGSVKCPCPCAEGHVAALPVFR